MIGCYDSHVVRVSRPLLLIAVAGAVLAAAAATSGARASDLADQPWQKQIRERDRKRLAGLWGAWTHALGQVRDAGATAAVAALGPVGVATAIQPGPLPVPGQYRCRTLKLGSREAATAAPVPVIIAAPFQPCTITARDGLMWFEQASGAQRVAGRLYPDGDRLVFLGSLALAGEPGVMRYGADDDRDQVGVVRGLGPGHWRLELPWPMWQSNLAIVEIVAGS